MTNDKQSMKKRFHSFRAIGLVIVAIALVFTFRMPAIAQTPRHYDELTFSAAPEIKIPKYERYQLSNGMVVYLMEDHQFPLVSGTALIRTGSRLEPLDKVGLAAIAGTVMRTGGTQQHPADKLDEILEQRAAVVETSIGIDSGTASFNTLSEDIDMVFDLFAEVIRYPAFAPDKIELAKTQRRGAIARRNDDPGAIANREFQKLIYGETSPYARIEEYTTIDRISREDIINFYQTYIRPDRTILGIVGDFDPAKMKAAIEKAFGDWQPPATKLDNAIPPASQKYQGGIFLVDRPQLTQSNIRIGHLGGDFRNPDYPALSVLNGVLNGFGGRLFNDLRSRQGLAYSVYGYWDPKYDYPGLFFAGGQTKSETTVPFVKSLLSEIEQVRTTPITEKELNYAKDSILNSFVFNFENPNQTLSRLMRYEYFGYPEDFIFQYQRAVKATTIQDVQRVAQKYLQPDRIVTLIVGNAQAIQPPLSNLGGEVKIVDISIPQPAQSSRRATTTEN
ncbi:putative Zn-dependent peptidase [Pleurocapsa sp. PCC 7327]|nr:putative Zn-dependent peptidase [Pleurocapsa sp. PCC 7327]